MRSVDGDELLVDARVVLADRDVGLTQRRLKQLVPWSEIALALVWEDGEYSRESAYRRMET